MEKAILTAADDNVFPQLMKDFLGTLTKFYEGKVYIIDYGITNVHKQELLDTYPFIVILPREKSKDYVSNNRMSDYLDAMKEDIIEKEIALMDCGDIWFQDRFDGLFYGDGVNAIEEVDFADFGFNYSCARQAGKRVFDEMMPYFQYKKLINAGVLGGNRLKLISLFEDVVAFYKENECDFFAYDQTIINYILRKNPDKYGLHILDRRYNAVLIGSTDWKVEDKIIKEKETGKPFVIIHNAGHTSRLLKQPWN